MTPVVYVDFDGTITKQDVGNVFFSTFGGNRCRELVEEYRSGWLSAADCFRLETEALGVLDLDEADRFLDAQEVDQSFAGFVEYCTLRNFPLTVVSDGLGYYIRRILRREGLDQLTVFANTFEPHAGGSGRGSAMRVGFPFADEECDRCGCCKRNVLLTRSSDTDCIVYIGDGYSDRCPVRYADIVFARGDLQAYCQRENISYYLYSSFGDISTRLDRLSEERKFRSRREASRLRQRAFLQG
jgi:2-hydroxy-3-keto-5-methylthiopentenyl-1-phosphate phosphatase